MSSQLKILVADRQIVRPGDILAVMEQKIRRPSYNPEKHIYIYEDKIMSAVLGLTSVNDNDVSVIPLEGRYFPRVGDIVIGLVVGVGITNWLLDIRAPYKAVLNAGEVIENFSPITTNLREYIDVGDYIVAKIAVFDRTRDLLLTVKGKELGKITEGIVIEIEPSRVPRVIGKKGSMLNLLTSRTGCNILVAQNGVVWIRCKDERSSEVVIKAIRLIESRAHMRGLTEHVRMFLDKELA